MLSLLNLNLPSLDKHFLFVNCSVMLKTTWRFSLDRCVRIYSPVQDVLTHWWLLIFVKSFFTTSLVIERTWNEQISEHRNELSCTLCVYKQLSMLDQRKLTCQALGTLISRPVKRLYLFCSSCKVTENTGYILNDTGNRNCY